MKISQGLKNLDKLTRLADRASTNRIRVSAIKISEAHHFLKALVIIVRHYHDHRTLYIVTGAVYMQLFTNMDSTILLLPDKGQAMHTLSDSIEHNRSGQMRQQLQAEMKKMIESLLQVKIKVDLPLNQVADQYFGLSWSSLICKRPDLVLIAIDKARHFEVLEEIETNYALTLAYAVKWPQAEKIYLKYKGKQTADGKEWNKLFIDDLGFFE